MKKEYLFTGKDDWTYELLEKTWKEIETIAAEELDMKNGVDYYSPFIEIVSAEQMLDAYSAVGLPNYYDHWSFGKDFMSNWTKYKQGDMGLAYEIVINSNPSHALLMEENDMTMQALVMAHACVGHSFCFKQNYLFQQWTDADSIIDYVNFAKEYIRQCEERYGEDEVEKVIDACHALQNYGTDTYKRKYKRSMSEEAAELARKLKFEEELQDYDDVMRRTIPAKTKNKKADDMEPQENILYFIEKNAPRLPTWKREIIRIVRKIAQYFKPQGLTKTVNEGIATFVHYYIMTRLEEKGLIDDGAMMKFITSHTGVVAQQSYRSPYYGGFNPYALGFAIFMDIKRICQEPTEEDKRWFPALIGKDWVQAVKEGATNYSDETFILQFLSPKVMRDFKLFEIEYNTDESREAIVTEIHDDDGYRSMRATLAKSYTTIYRRPDIQVVKADMKGDRTLTLQYFPFEGRDLHPSMAEDTIQHVGTLWGYDIDLIQMYREELDDEDQLHLITFYDSSTDDGDENE